MSDEADVSGPPAPVYEPSLLEQSEQYLQAGAMLLAGIWLVAQAVRVIR